MLQNGRKNMKITKTIKNHFFMSKPQGNVIGKLLTTQRGMVF